MTKKKIDIPKDWKYTKLGSLGQFLKGKGIAKSEVIEDGIPCVRYGEIYTNHNDYIKAFTSFTTQESANQSTKLEYGDILFAGSGETLEDIGKSVAFVDEFEAYSGGDIIILRGHNQEPKFLGFLLNTDFVSRQTFQLGQGHSVVHIYSSGLKNVKIPLPPLPEQQKIATILSTWDKAIAKHTQLIATKEQRKKGLMQQLLTGKMRFAGFTDEWKELKLCTLTSINMGQSPDSKSYNEDGVGLPLIQGNADLKNRKSSPRIWTSEPTKISEIGDLILTVRAPVGSVAKSFHNACIGRGVCSIKATKCDIEFIYQVLIFFEPRWQSLEQGSTFSAVSSKDIKGLKLKLPNSIQEQQKIASVLSAADKEIELLKNELERLQQQKKGLMQVLLTGEVRVKIN